MTRSSRMLARIAIVGDSCHPAMPKETFKASFERPIDIRVGGVVRIQEMVREDINVGVGRQRHIATGSRHVIILLGLSVRPDRGDADPIVSTRRHASIGSKVITDHSPLSHVGSVAASADSVTVDQLIGPMSTTTCATMRHAVPGKRGPCPLLLGPKRGQTQGGVQVMMRLDHRTTRRSLWLSGWA